MVTLTLDTALAAMNELCEVQGPKNNIREVLHFAARNPGITSPGIALVAKERSDQVLINGYSADHDDQHRDGEIIALALSFIDPNRFPNPFDDFPHHPPFDDRIAMLARAGACIVAEIERLQRLKEAS